MADIKTILRELSVATTIGIQINEADVTLEKLYSPLNFVEYTRKYVECNSAELKKLSEYDRFTSDLIEIINNGYKLGKLICSYKHFNFSLTDKIMWVGGNTQKKDPVDVYVGKYGFSFKEDSYILKNMGLYELLNCLTGSNYIRGLHVFKDFAEEEYDSWFEYTWKSLIKYLRDKGKWERNKLGKKSLIKIEEDFVLLKFNEKTSMIPIDIWCNADYMRYTCGETRENVFAKWINSEFSSDSEYNRLKKNCAETAGKEICDIISSKFLPQNIYNFFRIMPNEYYYAKTTSRETTILKVPSQKDFADCIKFEKAYFEVPVSQLNIISRFVNINTDRHLEFKNECRFSHGQFNGTPEAKMYVLSNTSLSDLYEPIK